MMCNYARSLTIRSFFHAQSWFGHQTVSFEREVFPYNGLPSMHYNFIEYGYICEACIYYKRH